MSLLQDMGEDNMLVYEPDEPTGRSITVFTDISCGFCRRLHADIDQLLDEGVAVRYLLFPRAGLGSSGHQALEDVWCNENPQEAMTVAKAGGRVVRVTGFCTMLQTLGLCLAIVSGGSGVVSADQNDPLLDSLFDDLAKAEDASQAARLESRIWQLWLQVPEGVPQQLIKDVESAMRSANLEAALTAADLLIEADPEYAEAWNKRATVRYLAGDYDGSVADIRQTLALEPRHFGAISGLGLIFLRQGDKPAALAAFEHVLEISPSSGNARASVERVRRELETDI